MTFIGKQDLLDIGERLAARVGGNPPSVYDIRIDAEALRDDEDPSLRRFIQHQALMRSYQGRYVLLPSAAPSGSILSRLQKHYDPREMLRLDELRANLEDELVGPLVAEARSLGHRQDCAGYVANLIPNLKANRPSGFLEFLDGSGNRDHYYRNFLLQSSVDLLAEASASALGVIGEYGEPQSALFRILIDEFGFGVHNKKHSVLYRSTLRGFGLSEEYNAYWSLFDTPTLELHNVIHFMFQSPRNLFLQIGFLLFAEASYQRSTEEHFRYLKRFHPGVDAHYFGEHAHIDIHHSAMVADEVVAPLVSKYGPEVGSEIVAGAELTRLAFERSGDHLLAVTLAFEAAVKAGHAEFGMPTNLASPGRCAVPATNWNTGSALQIGGIGFLTDPSAFKVFPPLSVGREVVP
ncbi:MULTISPECIES: iron-containing redox enzyme family protein [Rhizobium]|uniref:iron-containing redox enzyme family protein n=1 Tax=Rhizobium TaxID=379 RepID=UPI001FEF17F4|nr:MULTISPECIES: iron-containing redox enzyme family protein [Rhizobium]MDV4152806.1 iron-containing redox enzyme family protein [Rhizobium brockwellii]